MKDAQENVIIVKKQNGASEMTEKLYYIDSHMKTFTAAVTSLCKP